MFKSLLVVLFCLGLVASIDVSRFDTAEITEDDMIELFGLWLNFEAPNFVEASNERYEIFRENLASIIVHNRDSRNTWKRGINRYTGLAFSELRGSAFMESQNCSATNTESALGLMDIPSTFDWRTQGVVSKVKNQGNCGSCWTFSTTGALEANWAIYKKSTKPPLLSEQQLVDCAQDFNNHGCNGGLPSQAFEYIKHVGGLETETDYPYTAKDGECVFDVSKAAADAYYGSHNITSGDEDAILEAVATNGPVSIAYDVTDDFMSYKSGVYVGKTCGNVTSTVNHAVLVVGYGHDSATNLDYWVVKNSWGTSWGENGYFRIQRGVNMCGLAVCAAYPQIKSTA